MTRKSIRAKLEILLSKLMKNQDSYSERFLSKGQEFHDGFVKGLKSDSQEKKGK